MAKKNAISGKIEIEISGVKYTATAKNYKREGAK